jgi:two-component system, OmpR family, response regulator
MKNENQESQKAEQIKLFLVDDDALFLKSLEIEFLQHADFTIETFATGELCMTNLSHNPDVIILDYHLDGIDKTAMNGMETLDKIKKNNPDIPVVMLSSQDKIDVAINCMHHRAFDYVVKSETAFVRLQKIITTIFRYKKMEKELKWYMERM